MKTTIELHKRILECVMEYGRIRDSLARNWTQEAADSCVAKYGEIADMITVMGKRIIELEGGK